MFPLDVVCTRDIARRLLPNLPRCSLRALTGYFGRAVGPLRRSTDHVEATAFVWHELVRLLDEEGVSTWSALHDWLAAPTEATKRRRRIVAHGKVVEIDCFLDPERLARLDLAGLDGAS